MVKQWRDATPRWGAYLFRGVTMFNGALPNRPFVSLVVSLGHRRIEARIFIAIRP